MGLPAAGGPKVTEGALPPAAALERLARISPSRFTALQECALRECYAAARLPRQLPASPIARLGTAVHKLLEDAVAGRLRGDVDISAARRWDELVTEQEVEMASSWLERHFAPLRESIGSFDERRLQAIARVTELAAVRDTHEPSDPQRKERRFGTEVWVETADHVIGGYIDLVTPGPDGVRITDYKTGAILTADAAVKPEYAAQLKLYAAVYAEQHGVWPAELEIVSLKGDRIPVSFSEDECKELLSQARLLHSYINQVIDRNKDVMQAQEELAAPSPENCRYCGYRPSCAAYHNYAGGGDDPEAWPADGWGIVTERRQLGNGRLFLRILSGGIEARIRGITADTDRHPALAELDVGKRAEAFSLRRITPSSFEETPFTTLYVAI